MRLFRVTLLLLCVVSAAHAQRLYPDAKLTPGATLAVTKADLCTSGYAAKVRNVPKAVKDRVFLLYGIKNPKPGDWEVDHLIPLELGGSNAVSNLWPQSYKTRPWNAHVKDRLENRMHALVCSGQLDLATAQHDITTDWVAAWRKYFRKPLPASKK